MYAYVLTCTRVGTRVPVLPWIAALYTCTRTSCCTCVRVTTTTCVYTCTHGYSLYRYYRCTQVVRVLHGTRVRSRTGIQLRWKAPNPVMGCWTTMGSCNVLFFFFFSPFLPFYCVFALSSRQWTLFGDLVTAVRVVQSSVRRKIRGEGAMLRNEYTLVSQSSAFGANRGSTKFRTRMLVAGSLCCILLLVIYIHNVIFYSSLKPVVDSLVSVQDYVVQTQKDVRTNVFELLHNIRSVSRSLRKILGVACERNVNFSALTTLFVSCV